MNNIVVPNLLFNIMQLIFISIEQKTYCTIGLRNIRGGLRVGGWGGGGGDV